MPDIFVSWIGNLDIDSIKDPESISPIISYFVPEPFREKIDEIHLFSNFESNEDKKYRGKTKDFETFCSSKGILKDRVFNIHEVKLPNPTDLKGIHEHISTELNQIKSKHKNEDITWYFNINSGTRQMSLIFEMLVGAGVYNGHIYQTRPNKKTKRSEITKIDMPFTIRMLLNKETDFSELIYESKEMQSIIAKAERIAKYDDVTSLIIGETGTGKEEIAKVIKKNSSRNNKHFRSINCTALSESLIESILFGHTGNAFTGAGKDKIGYFEECDEGILFLDEIGDMPLGLQAKLLRVIQEGTITKVGSTEEIPVDVKIICATNKNIPKLIKDNKFREDLYYRINTITLYLPPLRKRGSEILKLAEYFLLYYNKKYSKIINYYHKEFSKAAEDFILNYNWPGNIRELKNFVQRICVSYDKKIIDIDDVKNELFIEETANNFDFAVDLGSINNNLDQYIDNLKLEYIKQALIKTNNNKSQAAKLLGYKDKNNIDYYIKNNSDYFNEVLTNK